jgi:hypothetical protein
MKLPRIITTLLCFLLGGMASRAETTLVPWGDNYYGQTNIPLGLTDVLAIAGSGSHSVALSRGGALTAWGWNSFGQGAVPSGLTNVQGIAVGNSHNLAITAGGTVVAWGNNTYGQTNVPAGLSNVVAVSGGSAHSLALRADGQVVAWGNNSDGQATVPNGLANVVAIAAGGWHNVALLGNGKVTAWGYDGYGQTDVPPGASNIIAISAGALHSMALSREGRVIVWGNNDYGQADVPDGLSNVIAIASGAYHCLALKANGTIAAWGSNGSGQTNVPAGLTNVIAIAPRSFALIGNYSGQCPIIIEMPRNCTAAVGASVLFNAIARGTPPLSFQWRFNGSGLPGKTNTWLALENIQPAQGGLYDVIVRDAASCVVTSSPARLKVVPLWVSSQPQDALCNVGETANFTAVIESALPVTYEWRLGSEIVHDDARVSGASTVSLSISNVGSRDAGEYLLVARNDLGVVMTRAAALRVTNHPPTITCQPQSQALLVTSNASFSVCVENDFQDYTLQWLSNGVVIPGKTASTLVLSNIALEFSAFYSCMVSNKDGVVFSDSAWLEVLPFPPFITGQPQSTNVLVESLTNGRFYTITVKAIGPDLRYLWFTNGVWARQNLMTNSMRLWPSESGGIFDCYALVTNQYGATRSSNARVQFYYMPPIINDAPVDVIEEWGASASFSVGVIEGDSPLSYQWRHDGQEIAGAVLRDLYLMNIMTNDSGFYDVVVTNYGGRSISGKASLTVLQDPPRFTASPQTQLIWMGGWASYSCAVTGALPINLQWRLNGNPLPGETNTFLLFQLTNSAQVGVYSVVASNLFGVATNDGAALLPQDIVLVNPHVNTNGFEFTLYNQYLQGDCRIQASEDLTNWADIYTFPHSIGLFIDTNAPARRRFYRVVAP